MLLNSTYDRGWRSDVGKVVEANKMLAVDLPPGTYTVHLHYWPHGLVLGIFITLASLFLLAILYRRHRRELWLHERAVLASVAEARRATVVP